MLARYLRNLLLAQLVFVLVIAGLSFYFTPSIERALVISLGSLACLRLIITLENFVISWIYSSPKPDFAQISLTKKLVLFAEEFYATLISSSWLMWRQHFSSRTGQATHLPVLLIHGYVCNSGYWARFSKRLSERSISHFALDLEPVFAGIDEFVPLVANKIEEICRETGSEKVIIVAHSMGGLVARNYMRMHGYQHIAHIITLGTPHHGTGLANFGPGKNSQQMRFSKGIGASEWLRTLADSEDDTKRALITSIYSHHDNIISPQRSSHLEGAKNIELFGVGHVALALNTRVQDTMLDEISLYGNQQ